MLLRAHLHRSAPPLLLLSLMACAVAPSPGRVVDAPPDSWSRAVTSRIQDGVHAFEVDGADYTARSPERGLTARFDLDGAWLETEDDGLLVRTVAVGRAGGMAGIDATPPTLGACIPGREDPEGACIPRLEYTDAGMTEWWTADDQGFEQGWTVESARRAGAH